MKLSKRLLEVVEEKQEAAVWATAAMARMKIGCVHLPDHFKKHTSEWYEGCAAAHYAAIESILHAYDCYNGYREVEYHSDLYGVRYKIKEYDLSSAK